MPESSDPVLRNPLPITLMIALLLLVAWLAGRALDIDPFWYDETRSLYYAGASIHGPVSLGETFDRAAGSDVQAPGYYALLNLWRRAVGDSALALRYLSLLTGVFAVAAVYRLGAEVSGHWRVGFAAAGLMGGSAFALIYLHELRNYGVVLMLAALVLWGYWRIVYGRASWGLRGLFVIAAAALAYTHYLAALLLVALALYHLIFAPKTRRWWEIPAWMALALVLFLPWLRVMWSVAAETVSDEPGFFTPTLDFPGMMTGIGRAFSNESAALLAVLLLLAVRPRERAARFGWFVLLTTMGLIHLIDSQVPIPYVLRYTLMLWPLVALLAALGLSRLPTQAVTLVLVVWVALGARYSLSADYRLNVNGPGAYAPWDVFASTLEQRAEPDDIAAMQLPPNTTRFYHEPVADVYFAELPADRAYFESLPLLFDDEFLRRGLAQVEDARRLWVARDPAQSPDRSGMMLAALQEEYMQCGQWGDESDALMLTLLADPPDDMPHAFGGDAVEMAPLFDPTAPRNDLLPVVLGWRVAEDVPPHTYSVALHVESADGELVAQADHPLPGVGVGCHAADISLADLAPGPYHLLVSVYAWETGERLPVANVADNRVRTGTFERR